jgi:hypothetical protein
VNEQELRALVRDVVARRLEVQPYDRGCDVSVARLHVSHGRLTMLEPTEPGSPCVIEPTVGCNQCGHCVSFGH